jgi:hypothetical protein
MDDELTLDGNALGGLLGQVFLAEITAAVASCDGCGAVEAFGALTVHSNAPGAVVRCPHCGVVLLRVVRAEGRCWLDMRGLRWLELHDGG